jgi:putative spermidine/putrescine transport system substrate-binding protein
MKKTTKIVLGLAVVSTMALAGCAPSSGGSASNDGRLVVGSFGGDYDTFMKSLVDPLFREAMPDTEILYSSGDTATLKTKLLAEAGSDAGTFDVVQLSDKDMPAMKEAGALLELDPTRISNWENIQDTLIDGFCVPHIRSAIGITYNPELITDEITDWDQLFEPEIASQAGQWERWSDYVFYGAAAEVADGDPGTDLSAGYDLAVEAAGLMRPYGTATQIKAGLISGEIAALVNTRANAAQWSAESGQEFRSVVPNEGSREYISSSCIPANSQNVDAAYAYLNAQLDPIAQAGFAQEMFYAPTVTNVELDPQLSAAISLTDDEATRIYTPDMTAITEAMPEMGRLWTEATR